MPRYSIRWRTWASWSWISSVKLFDLIRKREKDQQLQVTYGKWFDPSMLVQSRKDIVAQTGDEALEPISIRQQLHQNSKRQEKWNRTKEQRQER